MSDTKIPSLSEVFNEAGEVIKGPWKQAPSGGPAPKFASPVGGPKKSAFDTTRAEFRESMKGLKHVKDRFPAWVQEIGGDIDSVVGKMFDEVEATGDEAKDAAMEKQYHAVLKTFDEFLKETDKLLAMGE